MAKYRREILYLEIRLIAGLMALVFATVSATGTLTRARNDSLLGRSDEYRLVADLLSRYAKMGNVARPTYNSSKPMLIYFGMRLIQMKMLEKEHAMRSSVWVRFRWIDEYLRWDPRKYGGQTGITLPWKEVWTPDIALVNTAETEEEERHSDIMVHFSGRVFWAPHRIYKSACLIDVTDFPYDQHQCHMWFQSMAKYSWHLDMEPYQISPWDMETYLASFKESQEWEVIENSTDKFLQPRDVGVLLKFSRRVALRFTLIVRRRLGYTAHILMLPCVFLGCMSLIAFCLPPERPDRHILAMSLLASFMILLLILVEVAPPTAASVPKLAMYYACNMTLVMVSIFLSGLVINVSRRGERMEPVPVLLRLIFIDGLARVLCLHDRVIRPFQQPTKFNLTEQNVEARQQRQAVATSMSSGEHHEAAECLNERLKRMEDLLSRVIDNEGVMDRDLEFQIIRLQWRNVATVMDRLFFTLYVVAIVVGLAVLFPRPNYRTYDVIGGAHANKTSLP